MHGRSPTNFRLILPFPVLAASLPALAEVVSRWSGRGGNRQGERGSAGGAGGRVRNLSSAITRNAREILSPRGPLPRTKASGCTKRPSPFRGAFYTLSDAWEAHYDPAGELISSLWLK